MRGGYVGIAGGKYSAGGGQIGILGWTAVWQEEGNGGVKISGRWRGLVWGSRIGRSQWSDRGVNLLTGETFPDLLVFVICGGIFVEMIRLFF